MKVLRSLNDTLYLVLDFAISSDWSSDLEISFVFSLNSASASKSSKHSQSKIQITIRKLLSSDKSLAAQ